MRQKREMQQKKEADPKVFILSCMLLIMYLECIKEGVNLNTFKTVFKTKVCFKLLSKVLKLCY